MKRIFKIALPFLTLLLFYGCAGVQYQDDPLPVQLNYTEDVAANYIADANWWRAYNDIQLNLLVEKALTNNIDLAQSALTMQRAMYQANLSELDLFPTLAGETGASTGRDLYRHDTFSDNRNFSGELSLKYELDLWGKLRNYADADAFEFQATYFDMESVRLALINSVVDVYFNLAYLNGAVNATADSLTNYRQMQTITNAKYTGGKTDVLESLQILQTIKNYENDLLTYQTQIKDNEQVLRNLLNLKPNDRLEIHYPDMLTVMPLAVDLDVPLAVLANRPDLKASELRLQKAFKNLEAQNKSWYPSVTLKTVISSSDDNLGNTLDFPVILGSVSISLPFLSWNTVQTNINISQTDYESARLDFESAINTALNEVAYYYAAYVNSAAVLSNTRTKYVADIQIMELYDNRYNSGKVEFKDLLDSMNTVNSSQLALLSENYQLIKYENMIYKAMAGRVQ